MSPTADKTLDGVQNASHISILLPLTLASLEFSFSRLNSPICTSPLKILDYPQTHLTR